MPPAYIGLLAALAALTGPPAKDAAFAVRGTVFWEGKPAGAGVSVEVRGFDGVTKAATDAHGGFAAALPPRWQNGVVLTASSADGTRLARLQLRRGETDKLKQPLRLALKPGKRLEVSVRDGAGKPVEGARVGAVMYLARPEPVKTGAAGRAVLLYAADAELAQVFAYKPGAGIDYRSRPASHPGEKPAAWPPSEVRLTLEKPARVEVRLTDTGGKPLAGVTVAPDSLTKPGETYTLFTRDLDEGLAAKTDARGVAVFDWVPPWHKGRVVFKPRITTHLARTIFYDPRSGNGQVSMALPKLVAVRGRLLLEDGKPANGAPVQATWRVEWPDPSSAEAVASAEGRYELLVPPNKGLFLLAGDDRLAAAPRNDLTASPDRPLTGVDFRLRPATRLHGRITLGPDRKPYPGQYLTLNLMAPRGLNQKGRPRRAFDDDDAPPSAFARHAFTDKDGRFGFFVGPGSYYLTVSRHGELARFAVAEQASVPFDLNVTPPKQARLTGVVVSGTPAKPVAGAVVEEVGHRGELGVLKSDREGKFSAVRVQVATILVARSADGRLGGSAALEPDTATVTITLRPVVTARGRLVDDGKPVAGREVRWGSPTTVGKATGTSFRAADLAKTGADGRFEMTGLIVGMKYHASTLLDPAKPRGFSGAVATFEVMDAKPIDLGDVRLPKPILRPAPRDLAEKALTARAPKERLDDALANAKLARQRVLLIFGGPKAPHTQRLFALRAGDAEGDGDGETAPAFHAYQVVALPASGAGAEEMAGRLKLVLAKRALPLLVVLGEDGARLALTEADALIAGGLIDPGKVRTFLGKHAPAPLDARKLLADALALARKEKKRVLVQETATTCAPCWRLSRYLEAQRGVWEKDYVWVRIDRRWAHADAVMGGLKKGHRGGIPWLAVLGGDGKVLATSNGADGENVGFPSQAAGIDHFIGMLRQTRTRLSDADLARLRKALAAP